MFNLLDGIAQHPQFIDRHVLVVLGLDLFRQYRVKHRLESVSLLFGNPIRERLPFVYLLERRVLVAVNVLQKVVNLIGLVDTDCFPHAFALKFLEILQDCFHVFGGFQRGFCQSIIEQGCSLCVDRFLWIARDVLQCFTIGLGFGSCELPRRDCSYFLLGDGGLCRHLSGAVQLCGR